MMEKQRPGEYRKASRDATVSPPTLADLDPNRSQSQRWQRMASVPASVFEAHVASVRSPGHVFSP